MCKQCHCHSLGCLTQQFGSCYDGPAAEGQRIAAYQCRAAQRWQSGDASAVLSACTIRISAVIQQRNFPVCDDVDQILKALVLGLKVAVAAASGKNGVSG